jgi:hypothetical protein
MKKRICCFGSTAVLLCVLASNSASQGNPGLVVKQRERYTRSIALEFTRKNRNVAERARSVLADVGPNAFATGFLVGDGLVMTAYHVISGRLSVPKRKLLGFKPDDELEVRAYVGGCPAKVVKVDKDADLALLAVCGSSKDAKRPTFQLAPSIDDQIILIAQPHESKFLQRSFQGRTFFRASVLVDKGRCRRRVFRQPGVQQPGRGCWRLLRLRFN